MTDVLRDNLWRARLAAALLAVFAILAVTLTCVGIYGVMAYSITQRTGRSASGWRSAPSTPACSG